MNINIYGSTGAYKNSLELINNNLLKNKVNLRCKKSNLKLLKRNKNL